MKGNERVYRNNAEIEICLATHKFRQWKCGWSSGNGSN